MEDFAAHKEGSYIAEYNPEFPAPADVPAEEVFLSHAEIDKHCRELAYPNVCLYYGPASSYLMHACYAYVLDLFGISYTPVAEWDLAGDALNNASLLIVPGGFAVHGFEKYENSIGAGARVLEFLSRGGGYVGSCGGMFYLCRGQSDWLGVFDGNPLFGHEWWVTGTGLVNLALDRATPITLGCPPTMEVQYYHGPVLPKVGPQTSTVATFDQYSLPTVNYFNNPLQQATFDSYMKGGVAAVLAHYGRGGAVGFSPHPEIGELFRKYSGYRYHGRNRLNDDTAYFTHLGRYKYRESASFRLVLNAIHYLSTLSRPAAQEVKPITAGDISAGLDGVQTYLTECNKWRTALDSLGESSVRARSLIRKVAIDEVQRAIDAGEGLKSRLGQVQIALARDGFEQMDQTSADLARSVRWVKELTRHSDGVLWIMRQLENGKFCVPSWEHLNSTYTSQAPDGDEAALMLFAHVAATAELTGGNIGSTSDRIEDLLAEQAQK